MRMDRSQGLSVHEFLKKVSQTELETLLREKGDERFSGRIARIIIEARDRQQLPETTLAFADLIRSAVPSFARRGRIHPATRSFQALRIAVNREDEELGALLVGVLDWVNTGGRVAILSFHSGEDRLVKTAFRARSGKPKKPIVPTDEEIDRNPRARSAKLRVLELT